METTNGSLNRKLRMALVGGGQGAFIGRVHATAAVLDNRAELVAGALSSDPARAKASAPAYDIKADRVYTYLGKILQINYPNRRYKGEEGGGNGGNTNNNRNVQVYVTTSESYYNILPWTFYGCKMHSIEVNKQS